MLSHRLGALGLKTTQGTRSTTCTRATAADRQLSTSWSLAIRNQSDDDPSLTLLAAAGDKRANVKQTPTITCLA